MSRNSSPTDVQRAGCIRTLALLVPLLWCWSPWSVAQQVDELVIPYIDRAPELDDFRGMTASSEIAAMMARVEGFVQREPDNGMPASQDTTVYLAYDNRNLYAVFLAFDDEPDLVRANLAPRETSSTTILWPY